MVSEDRVIVERVLAGDREAFEVLVHKYTRLGGALAYGVLGDFDAAEDVVQEAFFKAFRSLASLRDPALFRVWFAGIVKKQAIDGLRRARTRRSVALPEGISADSNSEDAEERLEREETRRRVLEILRQLTEGDREVLVLKHMEGLSYKEIAEVTGTSVSAVESRLFRARKNLQAKLTHRPIRSDLRNEEL